MLRTLIAVVCVAGAAALARADGPEGMPPAGESCLYIPMRGAFGKEITAPGVRNAINFARSSQITHLILDFDTPGGILNDGRAVAAQLREAPDGMVVHGVVREAFSAATWPLLECDHIWVAPDARAGAAVAFARKEEGTGAVEVDRKFNAALAARLAARAEATGRPGALFRAMVDMEAEVWMATGPGGKRTFTDHKPAGEAVQVDSATSVLALTGEQMVEYGLARRLPVAEGTGAGTGSGGAGGKSKAGPAGPPGAAGKRLPAELAVFGKLVDGGKSVRDGAAQVQRSTLELERAEKRWVEANEVILEQAGWIVARSKEAAKADPRGMTLYYGEGGRTLTAASQINWKQATDRTLEAWRSVAKAVDDLERAVKAAEGAAKGLARVEAGAAKLRLWEDFSADSVRQPVDCQLNLTTVKKTIEEEIAWLNKHRAKVYIDQ